MPMVGITLGLTPTNFKGRFMDNNKFDHLIPEVSEILIKTFERTLINYPEFRETVDTSPLLNMTISIFINSLIHVLDKIKDSTIGEYQLIENIELAKNSIIKAIEDLPFVSMVEFI